MSNNKSTTRNHESDDDIHDPDYQAPPEKSIEDIMAADREDESLRRYKEALLGAAKAEKVIIDPNDHRKVIVKKLTVSITGRDDVVLDLTAINLAEIKKPVFTIKEGSQFKLRIDFVVQREIVHGLKYVRKTSRLGVPVDKVTHMLGSYAPKNEIQNYTTPVGEAPTGVLGRGTYNSTSVLTDDDKNIFLKWEWSFEIKKDWD